MEFKYSTFSDAYQPSLQLPDQPIFRSLGVPAQEFAPLSTLKVADISYPQDAFQYGEYTSKPLKKAGLDCGPSGPQPRPLKEVPCHLDKTHFCTTQSCNLVFSSLSNILTKLHVDFEVQHSKNKRRLSSWKHSLFIRGECLPRKRELCGRIPKAFRLCSPVFQLLQWSPYKFHEHWHTAGCSQSRKAGIQSGWANFEKSCADGLQRVGRCSAGRTSCLDQLSHYIRVQQETVSAVLGFLSPIAFVFFRRTSFAASQCFGWRTVVWFLPNHHQNCGIFFLSPCQRPIFLSAWPRHKTSSYPRIGWVHTNPQQTFLPTSKEPRIRCLSGTLFQPWQLN